MKISKQIFSYVYIILCAVLLALNYYIFIIENSFAPAGLNGIATMIQYKTGFSISYMSLIINIPLSIFAFFFIQKNFAIKTLLFSLVYSFSFLFLQNLNFEAIQYNALGHDTIYPVIISGVISGIVYGVCFKNNACTGGTDVLSRYINKKRPNTNFFIVTFILNAFVAIISLFVYSEGSLDYKPVALCITYCFISVFVGNQILTGTKIAYKFTIITNHSDKIVEDIKASLKHSATKIDVMGAYTNSDKVLLICVVNKHQLNDMQDILSKYDNTFSFYEVANETFGNFKHIK